MTVIIVREIRPGSGFASAQDDTYGQGRQVRQM